MCFTAHKDNCTGVYSFAVCLFIYSEYVCTLKSVHAMLYSTADR